MTDPQFAELVDYDHLALYDEKIKQVIATKADDSDLTAVSGRVTTLENTGGEANVIEGVSVNGTALTPANKVVDVTVPTKVSDLDNDSGFAANVIETITVNGTALTPSSKEVSITIPTTVAGLSDASNYMLKSDYTTAVRYKGTKATYSALPASGNEIGDLWNVEASDSTHGVRAGDNVVWNGTTWDVQAGTVDLTGYVESSDFSIVTNAQINALFSGSSGETGATGE